LQQGFVFDICYFFNVTKIKNINFFIFFYLFTFSN